MHQPEPLPKKYDHLFAEIDTGRIKIPKFQRDFVWSKSETAALLDSILRGYPIGTFILWKTREKLRSIRDIGNHALPDPPDGDAVFYVLDGQQRITSLYALRKGLTVRKDGRKQDYKSIFIDLDCDPEAEEELIRVEEKGSNHWISVYDLLNEGIAFFARSYDDAELSKIEEYKKRLTTYDFSTIQISDCSIEVACEVFTRINTSGQVLSLFDIMVAKTYDDRQNFDLAEKVEHLMHGNGRHQKGLATVGYESIPSSVILQCAAACLVKGTRRKDILALDKGKFIRKWDAIEDAVMNAVDYLKGSLRVPVSRLIPYNHLLVLLAYFFFRNLGRKPSALQNKLLIQYFWKASLCGRFQASADSRLAEDIKRIDRILKEQQPNYKGLESNVTLELLMETTFSTSDSFSKAILCLYAFHQPKSFDDNSIVKLDNDWLKTIRSKNYHHCFPRAYLKNDGWEEWEANCILNITIVDDYLNKRQIGARAPADYMSEFEGCNTSLARTMKSHLIGDLATWGIHDNDYKRFLKNRGKRVTAEIEKRLNPKI